MRECPRCGGRVAMRNEAIEKHRARGCDLTRAIDCPHPSHPAAQAVLELLSQHTYIDVGGNEDAGYICTVIVPGDMRALLATLEPKEETHAN